MIVETETSYFFGFLSLHGSMTPLIYPKIFMAILLGIFASVLLSHHDFLLEYDFVPFTAFGVALSLYLGFRNNACYDRWWEGRKLWGRQINAARTVCRAVNTLIPIQYANSINVGIGNYSCSTTGYPPVKGCKLVPLAERLMKCTSAHSHALRHQLRGDSSAAKDRNSYVSPEEGKILDHSPNPADQVLYFAANLLREMHIVAHGNSHDLCNSGPAPADASVNAKTNIDESTEGINADAPLITARPLPMDSITLTAIHTHLAEFCSIQGGCERIKKTPLPLPYSLLVHWTACFYVALAPFAIVQSCGWYTGPIMGIVSFVFFSLDECSRLLEDPFADNPYGLSLCALCRMIDISTAMGLGKVNVNEPLPEVLKPTLPENGVMW